MNTYHPEKFPVSEDRPALIGREERPWKATAPRNQVRMRQIAAMPCAEPLGQSLRLAARET